MIHYSVQHFPPCVTSILYQYLVYIRPFIRWTEKELKIEPEQPQYLFPARHKINIEAGVEAAIEIEGLGDEAIIGQDQDQDHDQSNSILQDDNNDFGVEYTNWDNISTAQNQGFWVTKCLTKELQVLSKEFGLQIQLNSQKLRQLAIGFSNKHLTAEGKNDMLLQELAA